MNNKGSAAIVDVLLFALMVSVACFLLIDVPSPQGDFISSEYADRVTQNTLLVMQEVPVKEFGEFSYTPTSPMKNMSKRKLREKSLTQLITEDVLLNPQLKIDNRIINLNQKRNFSRKLEKFLEHSLQELVGKRFGYRLIIQMNPIQISENKRILYEKVIEDFDNQSNKLSSESITLDFVMPQNFLNRILPQLQSIKPNLERKTKPLFLELELWSR